MEVFINTIKETLPSATIYFFVLLLVALKGVKLQETMKVALMYGICFLLVVIQGENAVHIGGILLLAIFLLTEVFTSDSKRRILFNTHRKVLDFLFRLFIEYYFLLFLVVLIISHIKENNNIILSEWILISVILTILQCVLFALSVTFTTREKFSVKNVSEIIDTLEEVNIHDVLNESERKKVDILIDLEDRTFLTRKDNMHSFLSKTILKSAFCSSNLRYVCRHPVRGLRILLKRGYGTIEMQLIRTIGIKNGYERCKIRRKLYEILYTPMIINSYQANKFERVSYSRDYVNNWILKNYLKNVSVRFNGRRYYPRKGTKNEYISTFIQLFDKDFDELSKEEFFVWCVALEGIGTIGPKTLQKKDAVIRRHDLNKTKIKQAQDSAKNKPR